MSSSSIIFCRWWTRQTELKSDSTGFKHRKWVCRKMQCTPISPSPLVEKNIFPMKWPWFQVPPIFRYPLADRLAPQWNHLAPAAHDASMMFLAPSAVSYKGVEKKLWKPDLHAMPHLPLRRNPPCSLTQISHLKNVSSCSLSDLLPPPWGKG